MKKLLFVFLMFSLSIAVFSQNVNYVELLNSIQSSPNLCVNSFHNFQLALDSSIFASSIES